MKNSKRKGKNFDTSVRVLQDKRIEYNIHAHTESREECEYKVKEILLNALHLRVLCSQSCDFSLNLMLPYSLYDSSPLLFFFFFITRSIKYALYFDCSLIVCDHFDTSVQSYGFCIFMVLVCRWAQFDAFKRCVWCLPIQWRGWHIHSTTTQPNWFGGLFRFYSMHFDKWSPDQNTKSLTHNNVYRAGLRSIVRFFYRKIIVSFECSPIVFVLCDQIHILSVFYFDFATQQH